MTFGEKFKELRIAAGLSQKELAEKLGYTNKSSIGKIENGGQDLPKSKIKLAAELLNTTVEYLVINHDPDSIDLMNSYYTRFYEVPLYASVSAGAGCLANEDIIGKYAVEAHSLRDSREMFALLVQGDSMEPLIHDGDIITVRKQDSVDSGDVAVVRVDGEEGLVKRVKYGTDWIQLISVNDTYPPRLFRGEDVLRIEVIGKVLDTRHRIR